MPSGPWELTTVHPNQTTQSAVPTAVASVRSHPSEVPGAPGNSAAGRVVQPVSEQHLKPHWTPHWTCC